MPAGRGMGSSAAAAVVIARAVAQALGQPLSDRDREICTRVGPVLRDAGVIFAGIDVIGDYLTEVNVTSPTGMREIDTQFDINTAGLIFDAIERRLGRKG